jgi:hypothetical protein
VLVEDERASDGKCILRSIFPITEFRLLIEILFWLDGCQELEGGSHRHFAVLVVGYGMGPCASSE